ncbi:MAG TPA: hypothetical protein VFE51_23140 [Verrucomicrobiae bacterium]|nr:hypothetical protein [Verrucomicrobiae bacterium]
MDGKVRVAVAQLSGAGADDELQGARFHPQEDPRRYTWPKGQAVQAGAGGPASTNSTGISTTWVPGGAAGGSERTDRLGARRLDLTAATNK